MLKRRKRERMGVRPETRVRSAAHLQFVRGHECAIKNRLIHERNEVHAIFTHFCSDRIEAHHVRAVGGGTTGRKPGDDLAVALCSRAHEEGHRIGWRTFEAWYRVNLTVIAAELWARSPAGIRYRREHEQD